MSYFLAKFSADWADEFDAEGLAILTAEEVEEAKAWGASEPYWYFGTNEGFEFEDLSDAFTFTEITEQEKATLERLIPELVRKISLGTFGQFPSDFEIQETDD